MSGTEMVYAGTSSLSSHMIATANSDSLIRLYRYPCVVSGRPLAPAPVAAYALSYWRCAKGFE
eukprot:3464407-Rhodomonas_salina.7